jgi:hypothetical protein
VGGRRVADDRPEGAAPVLRGHDCFFVCREQLTILGYRKGAWWSASVTSPLPSSSAVGAQPGRSLSVEAIEPGPAPIDEHELRSARYYAEGFPAIITAE